MNFTANCTFETIVSNAKMYLTFNQNFNSISWNGNNFLSIFYDILLDNLTPDDTKMRLQQSTSFLRSIFVCSCVICQFISLETNTNCAVSWHLLLTQLFDQGTDKVRAFVLLVIVSSFKQGIHLFGKRYIYLYIFRRNLLMLLEFTCF